MKFQATILLGLAFFAAVAFANPIPDVDFDEDDETLPDLSGLKTVRQAVRCNTRCRFNFCDRNPNLIVGTPDVAASDSICKGNRAIGIVGQTGEATISKPGVSPVLISQWRPAGLNQNFSPSFFKTFKVPRSVTSGVGHQVPQSNQHKFIDGLCVNLPIRSYMRVNNRGQTLNRVSTNGRRDCVAFNTKVPRIIVELMWQSGDDLDLHVFEPDGDEVFFANRVTEAGELLEDITSFCGVPGLKGRERTIYAADGPIESGTYTVQAQHFNNCGDGPSRWRLRLFIDGKLTRTVRGVSNQDGNEVIDGSVFTFTV